MPDQNAPLTPEMAASIKRSLADAKAGRVVPLSEVMAFLQPQPQPPATEQEGGSTVFRHFCDECKTWYEVGLAHVCQLHPQASIPPEVYEQARLTDKELAFQQRFDGWSSDCVRCANAQLAKAVPVAYAAGYEAGLAECEGFLEHRAACEKQPPDHQCACGRDALIMHIRRARGEQP